jgi:polygalacturonase
MGTYLTGSIHLAINLALELAPGATIQATFDAARYDLPEENRTGALAFQDLGPSHWHNSLLWGTDLPTGRGNDGIVQAGGNKAIALKNCRGVPLRDFVIQHGRWFAVLATGVDDRAVDNLRVDTNVKVSRSIAVAMCASRIAT